jgi:hypothetical protein
MDLEPFAARATRACRAVAGISTSLPLREVALSVAYDPSVLSAAAPPDSPMR